MKSALLVLALLVPVLAASPASADERIGLSRDRTSWSQQLTQPLFDESFRWVPGDVETESFYVRNQSDDRAQLAVDVLGTDADSLLETGDLTISARGGGGTWTDVSDGGTHRLVTWVDVRQQESSKVDVRVTFDPASPNDSQVKVLDLKLRVTLRQDPRYVQDAGGATGDDDADTEDTNGLLPDTGGPFVWWVFAGTALLVTGTMVAGRRRDKEVDHG